MLAGKMTRRQLYDQHFEVLAHLIQFFYFDRIEGLDNDPLTGDRDEAFLFEATKRFADGTAGQADLCRNFPFDEALAGFELTCEDSATEDKVCFVAQGTTRRQINFQSQTWIKPHCGSPSNAWYTVYQNTTEFGRCQYFFGQNFHFRFGKFRNLGYNAPQEPNQMQITSAAWAIFPLGFATALSLMGDVTLYTVLPTRFADAGIALGFVGVILSINRIIRLITNNAMGWFFDRLPNRRAIFLGSLALGVLTTTMYATSTTLPPLLLARLLWGLAWSGIWIGGNALVLEMAPETARGQWVGIFQMWFFFGSALASFTGGALTDIVGYRGALWIGASISAFGTFVALIALMTRRAEQRPVTTLPRARVSLWRNVCALSPAMWATVTAQGVNRLAAAGVVSATLGLIVQQTFGTGLQLGALHIGIASLSGVLLGSRTLISLVGAPIAGRMSDRARGRWGLLALSLFAGAIGTALLPTSQLGVLIFATIVSALAYGATQALSTALVGDLSKKEEYGMNLGLFNTSGDLGSAIGPLVAYALLPVTGLPAIYLGCGGVMLAMALWAMQFRHHVKRDA